MPAALQAARGQLATAIAKRDEAKPPATRAIQAQRLAKKRKATTAREKAGETLWLARQAVEVAQAAEDAARDSLSAAQAELASIMSGLCTESAGTNADLDVPWNAVAALLTQLDSLPAAIRAGNAETAWASIQANGVAQLQTLASKRMHMQTPANEMQQPQAVKAVAMRVAELQPPAQDEGGKTPTAAQAERIAMLCAGVAAQGPGPLFARSAGGGADPFKCDLRLATQ
jgi:hypothetical protein